MLAEIVEGYSTYLRNIEALSGGWTAAAQPPPEPVLLSYALAGSLDLPTVIRQQFCGTPSNSTNCMDMDEVTQLEI